MAKRQNPSEAEPMRFSLRFSLFFQFLLKTRYIFTTWHETCNTYGETNSSGGKIMNELSLIDSLFNDVLDSTPSVMYRAGVSAPRVDVTEDEGAYTLEMELPGRTENDVNIELDHDNLTISSKVTEEKESKEDKKDKKKPKYILKERRYSEFSRRFALPSDVDDESISANFKNGILTINMKKKAIAAPKKIQIMAS